METVVVDTDVISFGFKKDSRWRLFHRLVVGRTLTISFMTLAELDYWAIRHRWGAAKKADLARYLRRFEVHYPDRDSCTLWASIMDDARRQGRPMDKADAWIAATALALAAPLVTHNPDDYHTVEGLQLLTDAT
jgi:tRNA(fMet)-specific endonuclease VapC